MKKVYVVLVSLMLFSCVAFCEQKNNQQIELRLEPQTTQCTQSKKCCAWQRKSLAIGYSSTKVEAFNEEITLNQIAGRYWINDEIGTDFALGFSAGDKASILVSAKVIGKLFTYKILDIYWLGGIDLGNYDLKDTGNGMIFRLNAGVGAELYIIPCLSVLTEVGFRYTSLNNDLEYNSGGVFVDWLPQAGVRFYFN